MISGRKNSAVRFQGPNDNHQHRQEHVFEDLIRCEKGVDCQIKVMDGLIKIRTKDLAEYYMAKSCLKGMVSQEIVRMI